MSVSLPFDAAFDRGTIVCDDVVPAPSAAAVFNGLASPRAWRFVTRFGHYDGGVADARRHVLFARLHPSFADPAVDPEEAVAEADVTRREPA